MGSYAGQSGMVTLSRLTRVDIAPELTMTGRFFSGTEGEKYGLISKISENPLTDAEALARDIASKSPDAIAATKYLFKKTWKKDTWATLLWERWVQARLIGRRNQRTAMKNGMAKDGKVELFIDRTSFK
jgi:enoyl-CoA hydratase/carnithine racemase